MAVKIRLARRGRKKLAMYDVVVADARAPRDGRFIEKIGTYNPLTSPASIVLQDNRALHWLMNGAQPSDTVRAMLSYRGIMLKKHLQIGVAKEAITQEQADAKLAEWMKEKDAKIQSKKEMLALAKTDAAKTRREAETKIRKKRAEAIREKAKAKEQALVEAITPTEETDAEAPLVAETPVAETTQPVAESPAEEKSTEPKTAGTTPETEEPKA